MDKNSECYTVAIDRADNGDDTIMAISRRSGSKIEIFNTFFGEEAESKYAEFVKMFGVNVKNGACIIPKSNNGAVK